MGKLPFEERTFTLLTKQGAETSPDYGCVPSKRAIPHLLETGVINLNKPAGPSSHMVSDYVQKIMGIESAGHGGTLDPGVTGVLPVALNKATRVVQTLLPAGKEYACIMHLHDDIPAGKIREACKSFVGTITQLPPVKSAVKRVEREREIYYIDILEIDGRDVLFTVGCQAGTYIRKLCHEIGEKLGTAAHMAELVRTKAGPFNDTSWVSLQDIEDALAFYKEEHDERLLRKCILPMEFAVSHLPRVFIFDSTVQTICHGADLKVPGISQLDSDITPGNLIAILTLKGELVALGTARMPADGIMKSEKGNAVQTQKVFMAPGTYPAYSAKK